MRKILIQDSQTRLFLRADDLWTGDCAQARNFSTSLSAVAHCCHLGVSRAQVVVKFDMAGACDVVVPIEHESSAACEEC